MMRGACYIMIFLCYLQTKCLSNTTATPKGRELIFSYHANIDVRSSACNHGFARWILSGKLIGQHFNGSMVMKLEDLKTSIFNGRRENLTLGHEKPIPEDAKALLQPFIIHKEEDGNIGISVEPNEPLWSLNMKRGIANNFHLDMGKIESTEFTAQEKSIYGNCEVQYKLVPSNEGVLEKITDYNKCSNKVWKHLSNVRPGPAPKGFEPIQMKSVKKYMMKEENGVSSIHNIHSVTQLIYQAMPKIPNTQHVDQYQEFDLLETKQIDKEIDTSKITNRQNIIFDFGIEPNKERNVHTSNDATNLIKQFHDNFKEFEVLLAKPIQNHNMKNEDPIDNMFNILMKMDKDQMQNLGKEIIDRGNKLEKQTMASLLPYIGTKHAVEYLKYSLDFEPDKSVFNAIFLMRLLATFPTYLHFPLDDKLEELENMLITKNYDNSTFQNNALLSFASVIGRGFHNGYISEKYANKYQKFFQDKFLDNNLNYERRMMNLLALVNMAESVEADFIFTIITNTSENNHIRSLALTGFKKYLTNQPKVFETVWPIVQNTTEQLDLRIMALDLLLSTKLSEEQFNEILKSQRGYKTDLNERHIANYFITTLRSLQKQTGYDDAIGTLASSALKTEHFPDYSREWITGNYRLSYTDNEPNIGSYFQARLIGNPKIFSFEVLQFTHNHFAMSFDLGTYDIYMKVHGIPKYLYKKYLSSDTDRSIPELLKLLKKFQFEMKSLDEEIHFELVVFIDGRAVYGMYNNLENDLIDLYMGLFLTDVPVIISYPLMDYTYIPSDLGTPLSIMNDVQNIAINRSSWYYQTWLESYNPILDTTLASYKYYGDEKFYNLRTTISKSTIEWKWTNDSLIWVWDKLIGTTVTDKKILDIYCPECETYNEIPIEHKSTDIEDLEYLGIKLNITNMRNELLPNNSKIVEEFLGLHHSNTAIIPHLKPALMLTHFLNHVYYFKKELRRGSYRVIAFYDNPGTTKLTLSFEPIGFEGFIPFRKKAFYFKALLENKNIDSKTISHWNITYGNIWTPKYATDGPKLKLKHLQTFNLNYTSSNDDIFMICAERELLIPDMRADKFSILPVDPTTAKTLLLFGKVEKNESAETCPARRQYILTETYSATENQTNKAKAMKQYTECEKDAEGLKFIPPTPACLSVFMEMSQYSHYILKEIQDRSEVTQKIVQIIEATRIDNDKIKLSISKEAFSRNVPDDKYLEYIINYPYRMPDPTSIAYHDFDILAGIRRSCTISSKRIKTFTGKFIPFDEENSTVFIECLNTTRRGLTVNKLSDTNIGFKLWSNENVLTATVDENKLLVKLNGENLYDNYEAMDDVQTVKFMVNFMDKDVIYITDNKIQLYYNTEYIYLKALSMYGAFTCGLCNSEEN